MSTKIYDGVRFPKTRLGEFTRVVREKGLSKIVRRALMIARGFELSAVGLKSYQALHDGMKPEVAEWHLRVEKTMEAIGEAADRSERDPWYDLESGWRLWVPEKGPWILALPFGEAANHASLPSWVEDFGYWDNVDPPDDVAEAAWESRRKVWEIACGLPEETHQLLIEVFTVEKRSPARGMMFWWLQSELLSRKPKTKKTKRKRRA